MARCVYSAIALKEEEKSTGEKPSLFSQIPPSPMASARQAICPESLFAVDNVRRRYRRRGNFQTKLSLSFVHPDRLERRLPQSSFGFRH
jgi:hypothetical protein